MDDRTRPFTFVDYVWFLGGFLAIYGTIAVASVLTGGAA